MADVGSNLATFKHATQIHETYSERVPNPASRSFYRCKASTCQALDTVSINAKPLGTSLAWSQSKLQNVTNVQSILCGCTIATALRIAPGHNRAITQDGSKGCIFGLNLLRILELGLDIGAIATAFSKCQGCHVTKHNGS